MQIFFFLPPLPLVSLHGISVVSGNGIVSVCPAWQYGQSFSLFGFRLRGFDDLAEAFLLVSDFQSVFRRGSSSNSTSTTKINIYEDCLFKNSITDYGCT